MFTAAVSMVIRGRQNKCFITSFVNETFDPMDTFSRKLSIIYCILDQLSKCYCIFDQPTSII